MKVKEILRKYEISPLEAENMCEIVSDLLKAYALDTKQLEPTAFNTIRDCEKAAETVNDLGYMIILEDEPEDNPEDDPEDDSYRNCSDCPPEECDGHCMSCYYRSV